MDEISSRKTPGALGTIHTGAALRSFFVSYLADQWKVEGPVTTAAVQLAYLLGGVDHCCSGCNPLTFHGRFAQCPQLYLHQFCLRGQLHSSGLYSLLRDDGWDPGTVASSLHPKLSREDVFSRRGKHSSGGALCPDEPPLALSNPQLARGAFIRAACSDYTTLPALLP